MPRRPIPRAAAGVVAVLALNLILLVLQSSSASAAVDTRRVSGAAGLQTALTSARPGQVIELADGVYGGRFVASASGTAAAPIVLRGGRGAVLDGGTASTGVTLQLKGANHWRL
jgi:nitrous oxidase accessory protein NosD